jgi:hypothetical protein
MTDDAAAVVSDEIGGSTVEVAEGGGSGVAVSLAVGGGWEADA